MQGFRQYIEGLSSHGGYPFSARTGEDGWEYGTDVNPLDNEQKQQKDLVHLYRNSIKSMDEKLVKFPDHNFHIYYGIPKNDLLSNIKHVGLSKDEHIASAQRKALDKLFFVDMGIPRNDIVFLKAQHTGDPLTAWMTFHTLAHGLANTVKSASKGRSIYLMGQELINDLMREGFRTGGKEVGKYFSDSSNGTSAYDVFLKPTDLLQHSLNKYQGLKRDNEKLRNIVRDRGMIDEVFGCIFPFRSARTARNTTGKFNRIDNAAEITYELMAAYLWYGGDIPRPKPDCLKKIASFFGLSEEVTLKIIDNKFSEIELLMKQLLDSAAGTVVID